MYQEHHTEVREIPAYNDLQAIHPYWGRMFVLSILLIVGGIAAISYVSTTSIVTIMVFGILLIISGTFHLFSAIFTRGTKGFFISTVVAILNLVVGVWIIANPLGAAITLTLVLAIFFIISGILRITAALVYHEVIHWGWVLLSGILTLVLGGLIFAQWPVSGLWVIGLFVGIDVLFAGWTLMMLALAAKSAK